MRNWNRNEVYDGRIKARGFYLNYEELKQQLITKIKKGHVRFYLNYEELKLDWVPDVVHAWELFLSYL